MIVVGVAGKCCAGKDLATEILLRRGWQEVNVDHSGHRALVALQREVREAFGTGVLEDSTDPQSPVDRSRLGAVVFQDSRQMKRLEAITHPWMIRQVQQEVERLRATAPVVINAALLLYMNLDAFCDVVVLVRAPLFVRLGRAWQRDRHRMSPWRILRRLWAQRRLDAQAKASNADIVVVDNGGTREDLEARISSIPQLQ